MKTKSKAKPQNNDKKDNDYKIKVLNKKALLNLVNYIGTSHEFHFEKLEDSLEDAKLLRILTSLFNNNRKYWAFQDYLMNIDRGNETDLNKIKLAINYLSSKEPAFKVLLFDFEDEFYRESSLVLFYTSIFNYFFLKKPKNELYDRCYTILYGKYNKSDKKYKSYKNEKEILLDINTYTNLIYFIYSAKIDVNFKEISSDQKFKKYHDDIMIFNQKFLTEFVNEELPMAVYYQLQIIFNEMNPDSYNEYRKRAITVVERIFKANRTIRNIKVPSFDLIQKNVREKNISLFIQQQRYKKNFLNSQRKNEEYEEEEIKKGHLSFEDQSFDDILNKTEDEEVELKIDTAYFWDNYVSDESFNKGILFKETNINESLKIWKKIMTYVQKDTTELKAPKIKDYDIKEINRGLRDPLTNKKAIRLFNYIEELDQWSVDFSNMRADLGTAFEDYCYSKEYDPKNPIVLILDSFEDESIELTSKLIDFDFKINKNQITIYMVCNNFLSQITSSFDQYQKKTKYMPLFLILHVPKNKRTNPNIKTILFTAYSFLSFISNINVVILNKKHCIDQIEFITELFKINKKFACRENEIENYKMLKREKEKITQDSKKGKPNKKVDINIKNSQKMYLMDHLDSNDFNKKNKLLILINDDSIIQKSKANKNIFNEKIFQSLNDPSLDLSYKISFINIKNKNSYTDFIKYLGEYLVNAKTGMLEFKSKVSGMIDDFHIGFWYYYIRNEKDWKVKLKETIFRRYLLLNSKNNPQLVSPAIEQISEEIQNIYPSLDIEFGDECNKILSEFKEKANYSDFIFDELRKRSDENLNYINEIVKNAPFWSDEQMFNVRNGHIHFLKQEYFNILKKKYTIKGFFESNIPALNSLIDEECEKIKKIFEEFRKNMEKRKPRKMEIQKGANYSIREKENEREIKVRVDIGGKLEDLIEQDF